MTTFAERKPNDSHIYHGCMIALNASHRNDETRLMIVDGMRITVDHRQPVGKSLVMRASYAAEPRPLDAAENDVRQAESEYSHSDKAHQ